MTNIKAQKAATSKSDRPERIYQIINCRHDRVQAIMKNIDYLIKLILIIVEFLSDPLTASAVTEIK